MTQRTSQSLKVLSGTYRGDRNPKPGPGERLTAAPRPPAELSGRARAEYRRLGRVLVAVRSITAADLTALRLLAEVLAQAAELREILRVEGVTTPGADGNLKSHPAVRALEQARAQAVRLLEAFGLTPKSRGSVDAPAPEPASSAEGFRF